jgi:Protein of unknown function (DUF4245)
MAKNRVLQSVRDMVLSLGLVLGVVGLTLLITFRDEPDDPVRVVDTTPVVVGAATSAPYAVTLPQGVEPQWRPTSARVSVPGAQPFRWHIGYVTPSDEYAAAGQSNGLPATYLKDERAAGETTQTVRAGGRTWDVVEREDGKRTSLVSTSRGVTTLVTGTGTLDELKVLAASLRPVTPESVSTLAPVATTAP